MCLEKQLFFCLILLVNVTFAQVINSSEATLKILSNVSEAQIFVDSQDYGKLSNGELIIYNLPLGQHHLLLLAKGYDTFASTFELQANSFLEIKINLGELIVTTPVNVAKSNLTIKSEVESGKVFINGYYYGDIISGEQRIINLNSGAHRLTVVTEEYKPYVAALNLSSGEVVLELRFDNY